MYQSPYLVQILHEDRVREAMKTASSNRRVYDASEAVPNEYQDGLLHRIARWMNVKNTQSQQETRDARRAHAL